MESPLKFIAIAFGLLIIGIVLPFLMVIDLIESTLFVNFLAVGCSVAGLTTGFIGITRSSRGRK